MQSDCIAILLYNFIICLFCKSFILFIFRLKFFLYVVLVQDKVIKKTNTLFKYFYTKSFCC